MKSALLTAVVICVLLAAPFTTEAANGKLAWQTFLKRHCFKCHGVEKQEADLRLDSLSGLSPHELKTRWQDIRQKIADREMPPEDSPQPQAAERSRLLAWISETYGDVTSVGDHWSFKPVVRPEIPSVADQRANAIDAFILSALKEKHLTASSPADIRMAAIASRLNRLWNESSIWFRCQDR